MKWLRERKRVASLNLLEIWILLILKAAAGRWVRVDKIMAIVFLLERKYGLSKARFVPGVIPWSGDVVVALRRLASLGLAEELPQGGAYRLTEEGRMTIERYSLGDPKLRYPFIDMKSFIEWDVNALAKHIRVNYPEWA